MSADARSPLRPFGDRPIEAIFVSLARDVDEDGRRALGRWLEATLPDAGWRSHLFLFGEDPGVERVIESTRSAAGWLSSTDGETVMLTLHPVVPSPSMTDDPSRRAAQTSGLEALAAVARPFHAAAYEELSETRLLVAPIVIAPGEPSDAWIRNTTARLRELLFVPSFLVTPAAAERVSLLEPEARLHVVPAPDADDRAIADELEAAHVFETLLDRVSDQSPEPSELFAPCRRHRIADEARGLAFDCFEDWRLGGPSTALDGAPAPDGGALPSGHAGPACPACATRCLSKVAPSLTVNRRAVEGHQLTAAGAHGLSTLGRHELGAKMAGIAADLAASDADRTAARLLQGLCHLELRELPKAEEVLRLASERAPDPGLIAYHRGRVQFAWRDDIEALDRFEEALAAGSPEVAVEDLRFEMALCHVRLEEYDDARRHLDHLDPGKAPVSFYLGVCELNGGRAEPARAHFARALELGPAPEDRGRVLLYLGNSLKELERFDEAIAALEHAVEMEAEPENLAPLNLLGFCLYKVKRHAEAVRCFERCVQLDPRSAIDWANLGSNLRDLGRVAEAIEMYERALALDPGIDFAKDSLARLRGGT